MRTTFTQLQTKCKSITQNPNLTDTTILAFFKSEINIATRFIYAELQDYMTTKSVTRTTVAATQFYQLPPDFMQLDTVTVNTGTYAFPLRPIKSQMRWDELNTTPFSSAIPTYYFVRRDDIGIWPTPQAAYTMTYNYTYRIKDMVNEDYSTGTIALTAASATATGSGTTWTAAMVNRWLIPTTDGLPYRIASRASNTSIDLQDVFRGTTTASDTYIIGETPEIPPELHELIPYKVAAAYFSGVRKDVKQSEFWNNMFWTGDPVVGSMGIVRAEGGLLGAKKRYSGRNKSHVIRKSRWNNPYLDRQWATTLSDS